MPLDLPWPITLAVFVAGALLLSFGPYVILRRVFTVEEETERLAGSVLFRIGGLHALILALVFADAQVSLIGLRDGVATEATALTDVYYDLARYGTTAADEARTDVVVYTRAVIEDEWPRLAERRLSGEAWAAWQSLYNVALDLAPETPRQEYLRGQILQRIQAIAAYREERRFGAARSLSGLFWSVAVIGFFLVALPYFVFRPTPAHLFLMTAFAVFNGLVMFIILATNHPFTAPVTVDPTPFEVLLSTDMARN